MLKKVKIITNPIAGSGRAMKFLEHLKTELAHHQIETELKVTTQAKEAIEISREHSEDSPIVCLGGDGTVNEIINGLISNKHFTTSNRPAIGIIPFGSGNVIAKELHLKRNIRHFIHLYQNNLTRYLDVGCVHPVRSEYNQRNNILSKSDLSLRDASNGVHLPKDNKKRYFISMAGVGFDAEVARQYQSRRGGRAKLQAHLFNYFPIALKTIPRYQMPRITIQTDEKIVSENASFVQVANVKSYGGPFVLVNNALPDDGLLDVLWFNGVSPFNILVYYTMAFLGMTALVKAGDRRVKKVTLSSAQEVSVQVDGDWCGYLPVEIAIIPKGIRVFTSR